MSTSTQTFRGKVQLEQTGDRYTQFIQDTTTPGLEQTLFTYTVPSGKTHIMLALRVVTKHEGSFTLDYDSTVIASGRTGAAQANILFNWHPYHSVAADSIVTLKYKGISNKPSVDIEAYLEAREI